jgi:hypothetical protein
MLVNELTIIFSPKQLHIEGEDKSVSMNLFLWIYQEPIWMAPTKMIAIQLDHEYIEATKQVISVYFIDMKKRSFHN